MTAGSIEVKIAPVVGPLRLRLRLDHRRTWVAEVVGHPGCVGDGASKAEAIRNAVALYLHTLILRINKGLWTPQIRKPEEDDA